MQYSSKSDLINKEMRLEKIVRLHTNPERHLVYNMLRHITVCVGMRNRAVAQIRRHEDETKRAV